MNTIVLLSGGLDSTTSAQYFKDRGHSVQGLFFDYGHRAKDREYKSAKMVADYYGFPIQVASFVGVQPPSEGDIRGRNALFICGALMSYPNFSGILTLGIHAGTPYYDCGALFIKSISGMVEAYTDGQVVLDLPFVNWDKGMIYAYAISNGVPLDLTYSCEAGTDPPCGRCLSCRDRNDLTAI